MLQRVHLDIQVGEHTNNYPEIAAKDKLTELQLRVRQLLDQVEQIQKEQNYQRVSKKTKKYSKRRKKFVIWFWSNTLGLCNIVRLSSVYETGISGSQRHQRLIVCRVFHSIARSASAWRARAPTSACSGGPSLRRSSSSSPASGRWSTSRASLRPRNWCNGSVRAMPPTGYGSDATRQTLLTKMERRPPTVQRIQVGRRGLISHECTRKFPQAVINPRQGLFHCFSTTFHLPFLLHLLDMALFLFLWQCYEWMSFFWPFQICGGGGRCKPGQYTYKGSLFVIMSVAHCFLILELLIVYEEIPTSQTINNPLCHFFLPCCIKFIDRIWFPVHVYKSEDTFVVRLLMTGVLVVNNRYSFLTALFISETFYSPFSWISPRLLCLVTYLLSSHRLYYCWVCGRFTGLS